MKPDVAATEANGLATTTACAGCGAPLAPDQRYCLACGRPCSPVRLAFLDVLQAEHPPAGAQPLAGGVLGPTSYSPPPEPPGPLGSLRRYSGLFGLLGVLLAALLIGLLLGHWITAGPSPAKQVLEVKGLSAPLAAAAPAASSSAAGAAGTSTGAGSNTSSSSSTGHSGSTGHSASSGTNSSQAPSSSKSEKAEEAEAAKEVKTTKALPPARKTSTTALQKVAHTTGKQHEQEVAALGNEPIETGGH